jgi:hypothetical protein
MKRLIGKARAALAPQGEGLRRKVQEAVAERLPTGLRDRVQDAARSGAKRLGEAVEASANRGINSIKERSASAKESVQEQTRLGLDRLKSESTRLKSDSYQAAGSLGEQARVGLHKATDAASQAVIASVKSTNYQSTVRKTRNYIISGVVLMIFAYGFGTALPYAMKDLFLELDSRRRKATTQQGKDASVSPPTAVDSSVTTEMAHQEGNHTMKQAVLAWLSISSLFPSWSSK